MIKEHDEWLIDYFENAKKRNPSFSLRAFAKLVGISPSLLSQILNGNRELTSSIAAKILKKITIEEGLKNEILLTYQRYEKRKKDTLKEIYNIISSDNSLDLNYKDINAKKFPLLSSWRARVLFININLFWQDIDTLSELISEKYSMPVNDFESYIDEFLRAGLVEVNDNKIIRLAEDYQIVNNDISFEKRKEEVSEILNLQEKEIKREKVTSIEYKKARGAQYMFYHIALLDDEAKNKIINLSNDLYHCFNRLGYDVLKSGENSREYLLVSNFFKFSKE